MSSSSEKLKQAKIPKEFDEETGMNKTKEDKMPHAFDSPRQKRGHTSMNGVVTVTSFDTGKVLDFERLYKFCTGCVHKINVHNPEKIEGQRKACTANYEDSSCGMEVAGTTALCARSEHKLSLHYVQYLGYEDSKGIAAVLQNKPYDDNIDITKLECVGHVQKRVDIRFGWLKRDMKGQKLSDDKGLGGKGRLTDSEIDQLHYFHKISTDANPQHFLCPYGDNSWCKFNQAKAKNQENENTHQNPLPEAVMIAIKPVLNDLSKIDLLKRCLHGKTKNTNESFNSAVWQRLPKTVYNGLQTLKLGVADAVVCFNEGSIAKANVFEILQIKPGKFMMDALKAIDAER
ncbi:hypothetical protein PR048_032965 [Dryococelus australis]|uniref:Mutator-like transposase domain-containing protein n=1 Tax=Dryococelus australis TaxID=614101 RepID=A0ABQ9G6U9_9NEOP|nr:hypothetical protein PR048_032965 [Dryococelus australis]